MPVSIDPQTGERVDSASSNIDPVSGERKSTANPDAEKSKSTNWFGFQDTADQKLADFSRRRTPEEVRKQAHIPVGSGEVASTVGNVGSRALAGVAGMVVHPLDTLKGVYETGRELVTTPVIPTKDGTNALGEPMHGPIQDRVKAFQEEYARSPREAVENLSGDLLGMYLSGKLIDAAGKPIKVIGGKGMDAIRPLRESMRNGAQSMVGAGERAVKTEVGKTAESAGTKAKATEEANRAELKRHAGDVKAADQKDVNAHVQHASDIADTEQANAAARAIPDSRAGLESHIADTTKDADVRIEKARHDALEEGNRQYSGVNKALGHIEANPETVVDAIEDAAGKIRGSNTKVPILEDISKRFIRGERSGAAEAMTYSDLQGYYSELGREISRGTLPGDVYKALDTLHESIGDEMQRIADSEGKGDELKAAREYWRRMKQTFGDTSDAVSDRAGKELADQSPDYKKGQVSEHRQRLLGSFDPEIPKLLQDVAAKREQLSKFPTEATRPTATAPKYPERTEVTPPRTNPVEVPKVSTREIRERKLDEWTKGEGQLSKFQVRSLFGGIGALIGGVFEGRIGAGFGGVAGSVLGPAAIAKIADVPAMREWLTRPPAGELETLQKLPYADRIQLMDGLKKVAAKAQAQGVEVSPVLLKAIGATAALPRTQQLQETRDAQRQATQQ